MSIKDKGLSKVAGNGCAKNIKKSRAHLTGHFKDVTPCPQVSDLNDELTDSLLYLLAKVISGSVYSIAIGLGVSINCIPDCSHMRIDNTIECLKIWRNKTSNATTALLMEIVKKAVLANDVNGSIMNYHYNAKQLNSPPTDRLLLAISSEVVNREIFIIGHLGLSQTEYDDNPSVIKHTQIMVVLKKWRQEHTDDCSVTKFLECIQRADRDVIYRENVRAIKRVVEEYQHDRSAFHTDDVHDKDDQTHTQSGCALKQKKQSKKSGQTKGVPGQTGGVRDSKSVDVIGGYLKQQRLLDHDDNDYDYFLEDQKSNWMDDDFFLEN